MEELRNYLEFNKKIEIEKLTDNKINHYKTALYKETEHEFCFYKPKDNTTYIDFEKGETVRLLIYTLDGVYTFKTTVIKNGTKLLKIQKPQNYKKIQRRALLRQALPIKVKIEYEENDKTISSDVNIVDISGGGISFSTNCELFNIKRLFVQFVIENKEIKSFGEIIEIRRNRRIAKGKYRLSVRFVSLDTKDRDYIIKQCLVYQIKTRIKKRVIN